MLLTLDGRRVHVATGGQDFDLSLPCFVFLHGAQNDACVWSRVAHGCADAGHAVLVPDLPGHGQSEGPPLPDIAALADWLLALLEKVGAGGTAQGTNITLVGHSMGSLIALEAAARAPQRIGHLVLVGCAVPMPVAPLLLDAARDAPAKAMQMINRWSLSAAAARGANRCAPGHGLWLPALGLRVMERQAPAALHNDLAACNAYLDGPAAAARLACPVTLVAGTADRMTPLKAVRAFAATLPHAQLHELPGLGHSLMAEAPDALRAILRRLPADASRSSTS
jgi:pimeloyl-ACP methyl ester carboxylesterase